MVRLKILLTIEIMKRYATQEVAQMIDVDARPTSTDAPWSAPVPRLDSIALSLPTSLRSFDCTGRALMLCHALSCVDW
jgi:hypothetical protein